MRILLVLFFALTAVVVSGKSTNGGRKNFGSCTTSGDCPSFSTCTYPLKGNANKKVCVLVDCGSPTAPENGQVSVPTNTTLGQTATFSCNDGFVLIGDSSITCLESGDWENSSAVCMDGCGDPAPGNGSADAPSGTTFGETATFTCDEGFSLTGDSEGTCLETGTWNGSAVCIVDCGGPPAPGNGTADASSGTTIDSKATFSCDEGFSLIGDSEVTCVDTGEWDGNPVCLVDCGDPAPGNGTAEAPSGTTVGETATLSCDEGFYLIGDSEVTCLANREWDGSAVCSDRCDPLTAPDNGLLCNPDETSIGKEATFACDVGYKLNSSSPVTCLQTGQWSGGAECIVATCGGDFSLKDVYLKSPNYPIGYNFNEDCSLILSGPEGTVVVLEFFYLEIEASESCSADYLVLHDGVSECDPLIGRYCDSNIPIEINSTSNHMYARFVTDSTNNFRGFTTNVQFKSAP